MLTAAARTLVICGADDEPRRVAERIDSALRAVTPTSSAVKSSSQKPHHGRLAYWSRVQSADVSYHIYGYALDHPLFSGMNVHTSEVLTYDATTGEVETQNTRYRLVPANYQNYD